MLREQLNKGFSKILMLLAVIVAFATSSNAWNYYYLRGDGDDYDGGKRVALTWNSTTKLYEGTLEVTAESWTCKVTTSDNANSDDGWFGPSSDTDVSGDATIDFGGDKKVTFKKGTYEIAVKPDGNNQGWNPVQIIVKVSGGVQEVWSYYYLRGSGDDYSAGKRVSFAWNNTEKQYEAALTVDADQWICKITTGKTENDDNKWFGPSEEKNVSGQTNFDIQAADSKEIKFSKGAYNLYLKTSNNEEGKDPAKLYITGGNQGGESSSNIYIYGDFSRVKSGYGNEWGNHTWKQMTLSQNSTTVYEFKLDADKTGTAYFRINDSNTIYGPDSDGDVEVPTTNSWVNGKENESHAYSFAAVSGYTYYIKYANDSHSVSIYSTKPAPTPATPTARPTSLYFYSNNFGALGEKVPLMVRSADGKTFTYRCNYTANTTMKFNFREYPGDWRGARVYPNADATAAPLSTELPAKYDIFNADPSKTWSFTSTKSDPITITVTFPTVNTAKVEITQAPAPTTETAYYIHAGFLNNWDRTQRVKFMQLGDDPKVLTASIRYHEYNAGNKGFKITDEPKDDNGKWYSTGNELANGNEVTIGSEKGNMKLYESALGKAVTLTLTLDDNNKPSKIKADWVGNEPITIGNQMPVYPIGVYTNTAFKRYDEWPVLYLKGRVLNDMRITPEYQLTQITPTKYELEFTARNSTTNNGDDGQYKDEQYSIVAYFDANSDAVDLASQSLDLTKIKTYNDREHDGTRYKAVCEKGADGNWTFTLSPVGNVDDIPFISMIGQDWYQRVNEKTPYGNKYTNHDKDNLDTKWGWQESWIQYDANGQVLKDRSNKVMYNTMWPPRNPILFKTEFKVGSETKNFTLNSKDLTFVKVETHKGSEWKNHEFFKNYKKAAHDKGNPKEIENALALDDNTEYTLYRVENMWINGHVKIWTGWGGVTYKNRNNTTDLANWDFHTNWGHYKEGGLGGVYSIKAGATVPLSNQYGDMEFNQPTFFKYVDLFIDNSKTSNEKGYSVLFTELAKGGAQIAALSSKDKEDSATDYEVGNYQPSLNYVESVSNGIVKKVVINCYNNSTREMVEPVFSWTWNGNNATKVANKDFYKIFEGKESMFGAGTNEGSYSDDNGGVSKSKWVRDKNEYVSGDYFYRMTVTLSDDPEGAQAQEVIVDSNPFTIVKPEKIDIDVYQLVKISDNVREDGTVEGGVVKGEYYTYRQDPDDVTKSLLPIYKLTITNDDKFDGESYNFEYDDNGNMIGGYIDDSNYEFTSRTLTEAEADAIDFTSSELQITDKILIVGTKPTVNSVNGYSFSAENVNGSIDPPVDPEKPENGENTRHKVLSKNGPEKEGGVTEEYDQSFMRPDQNNRFMHVTNAGTFNQRQIEVKMEYLMSVYNEATGELEDILQYTDVAQATYQPIIPEPTLVDAKVEVFYGTNATEDTDDDTADFTYKGKKFKARFHNVRDYVEIEYPNVSRFMMERMRIRDFFTISMIGTDSENPEQQWTNVFNFGDNPNPAKQTSSVATGDFMLPKDFNSTRTIHLEKKEIGADGEALVYLPRWGEDKQITPIEVTGYAPNNLEVELVKYEENGDNALAPRIDRDENGDLISQYTIRLKHLKGFNPLDPTVEDDHSDHDDAYYTTPDENGICPERHNYIYHEGKEDLKEPLHHHSEHDYYYVAIIDLEGNVDTNTSDAQNIIDENGLKPGQSVNSGDKKVEYNPEKLMHFIVPATDLLGGNSKEITIKKNYGQEGDWSTDFHGSETEAYNYDMRVAGLGNENHFSKNIHVLVSYLYPFKVATSGSIDNTTTDEETVKTDRPTRAKMEYSDNVMKSEAAVLENSVGDSSFVITGVEALSGDRYGSVKVGAGFIEVEGIGVQVVNAAGVLVGEGEGHYDVNPGVYVVRYNGKTTKVVVR